MAVLTETARAEVWADFMRSLSTAREGCTISKAEMRAAVDAADAWIEANAASFNSALPAAARAGLTTNQKARLLAVVTLKRFGG
jgi:hypothetical protein